MASTARDPGSFTGGAHRTATRDALGTIIAAYAAREDWPAFPFWPLLFDNVTIRLLGSDDFPADANQKAAADQALVEGVEYVDTSAYEQYEKQEGDFVEGEVPAEAPEALEPAP